MRIAGIPVEQAGSWEEGWEGITKAGFLAEYQKLTDRAQYFVVAHDGDNSQGRAGSLDTWQNAARVTYSEPGITGMGIDSYLKKYPIPANDVAHVQDGSGIDTRDSSADPQWHHWKLLEYH